MKVLISDKSSPVCAEILRNAGHDVDINTGLAPEELKKIIGEYDGLVVRSATKVTAEILEAATNLKVIGRAGTGVDNIDVAAATAKNVVVMNTPGGNSNAVAELALGLMLTLARHIYIATASLKDHRWEKKALKGTEIEGKTLGILGYGRVSRMLAEKCAKLGMSVLCYDPKVGKDIVDSDGLTVVSNVGRIYAKSDYISVHLTRREDTVGFVGKAAFGEMKDGVYLVNCSRGGVVSEEDLLAALDSGKVAGAALDVYDTEPPTDFRLVDHDKVVCTPHIGASSDESQEKVAIKVAEQFVDMFADKGITNAVN